MKSQQNKSCDRHHSTKLIKKSLARRVLSVLRIFTLVVQGAVPSAGSTELPKSVKTSLSHSTKAERCLRETRLIH